MGLSDYMSVGNALSIVPRWFDKQSRKINPDSSYNRLAQSIDSKLDGFYKTFQNPLYGAMVREFANEMPLVGQVMRGVQNAQQLYKTYNATGHLPAKAGQFGGFGSALSTAMGYYPSSGRGAGTRSLNTFYKQF